MGQIWPVRHILPTPAICPARCPLLPEAGHSFLAFLCLIHLATLGASADGHNPQLFHLPLLLMHPPAKALILGLSLPLPDSLSHTLITGLLLGIWGVFLCNFCSYYDTKSVLLCLGITALVCLSVTIFSFQTKVG